LTLLLKVIDRFLAVLAPAEMLDPNRDCAAEAAPEPEWNGDVAPAFLLARRLITHPHDDVAIGDRGASDAREIRGVDLGLGPSSRGYRRTMPGAAPHHQTLDGSGQCPAMKSEPRLGHVFSQ
jgi:hypothetical protein